MKRAAIDIRVLTGLGAAFFFLLTLYPACAQEEEEQEGTQEQVEAEDNVTLCVTNGVAKDGEKDLIVFDKDNPEEEWEVNARVKFRPKPEKEYILRDKKYNWTAGEGFTVSKADDARPKIKATAEAAGTEGKLKLHLSWEEENLDEEDNPTGEIKIHPWSNDKASMRLLVPEFELQSVSYNLGDNGANGALPFYDNGDPDKSAGDPTNKPRLITAPEYVKNDTRPADNIGLLYKKGITPKMKAQFAIMPATAGDIVLFADQSKEDILPAAHTDENQKLSGTSKEALLTCDAALPDKVCSGTATHEWRWQVYGREILLHNNETGKDKKRVQSKVSNAFIVLNKPNTKNQEAWINCMKYGIQQLDAQDALNSFTLVKKIVPEFRNNGKYTNRGSGSCLDLGQDENVSNKYNSYKNITQLYSGNTYVNCYDSAYTIFVVFKFIGGQNELNVVWKKPWRYNDFGNAIMHSYNVYNNDLVFDPTPVWENETPANGEQQRGKLTEQEYFIKRDVPEMLRYPGQRIGSYLQW